MRNDAYQMLREAVRHVGVGNVILALYEMGYLKEGNTIVSEEDVLPMRIVGTYSRIKMVRMARDTSPGVAVGVGALVGITPEDRGLERGQAGLEDDLVLKNARVEYRHGEPVSVRPALPGERWP